MKIYDIAKLDVHASQKLTPAQAEAIFKECYAFQERIQKMSKKIGVSIDFAGTGIFMESES